LLEQAEDGPVPLRPHSAGRDLARQHGPQLAGTGGLRATAPRLNEH
jgi:hypothetical protein